MVSWSAPPLSVLDVAPVGAGVSTSDELCSTLARARYADQHGFTRYWVAEHHNNPGIASSAPPVLIGALAAATKAIRVGAGGVLLRNHPPLVVAEQFGTLLALHPDRVDLGIGRAPGGDPVATAAIGRGERDFDELLDELNGFLAGEFTEGHPYAGRVFAVPRADRLPPLWLLGSSARSAEAAGSRGVPFAFAHHFPGTQAATALAAYRSSFRPSPGLARPYAVVTVQVACFSTDAEAQFLALPAALAYVRLTQGVAAPLCTPDEAEAHHWSVEERRLAQTWQEGQAIGSPSTVRAALRALVEQTGADELMVTNQLHGSSDRLRSLEQLRSLFDDLPVGQACLG